MFYLLPMDWILQKLYVKAVITITHHTEVEETKKERGEVTFSKLGNEHVNQADQVIESVPSLYTVLFHVVLPLI